jgi:hypothetical protein
MVQTPSSRSRPATNPQA